MEKPGSGLGMLSLFSSEAVNFEVWLCFLFFSHMHWLEAKEQVSCVPCRAHAWAHGIGTHACIWSDAHSDPWHTWCNDMQKSDSTDPALSSEMGSTPVEAHRPADHTRSSESCGEHHTPSLTSMSCYHPVVPTGVTVPASHPAGTGMCFGEGRRRMDGKTWWLDRRTELRNSPLSSLESSLRKKFTDGQI